MIELLSPAGSVDALRAAVQNGANAVYLGYGSFHARQNAKNFTADDLAFAVQYCHVRGVKVHLTLNTLVSDRELEKAAEIIRTAAELGVDALIVQDLGVVSLCRQIAPHMELHASTQMSVHSLDGVKKAAEMGLSRVVLARELPREQIAAICKSSPIEIEVFVHGALCMCYSGQCYMSAMIGQRSGNRGRCAQPCRLPYGVGRFEQSYPLSLKDNCLVSYVRELEQMGVASIKIEGRMKQPEYVAITTAVYRAALDGVPIHQAHIDQLRQAFSRQGFTDAYYRGHVDAQMLGIRTDKGGSAALFQEARATYENGEAQLVPVQFYAIITEQDGSMLAVQDAEGHICKTVGPTPQPALTRELTQAELEQRLGKTGGTPYYCTNVQCVLGAGLMLSASDINKMRRTVLAELDAVRGRVEPPKLGRFTNLPAKPNSRKAPVLNVSVLRAEQVTRRLLSMHPEHLYVPLDVLMQHPNLASHIPAGTTLVAVLPRVIWDNENVSVLQQLERAAQMGVQTVLAGNIGQLALPQSLGFRVCGDFGLNTYNSRSLAQLEKLGFCTATASFEMTLPQIRDLQKRLPTEMIVYGRLPLMLTQTCFTRNHTGACTCHHGQMKLVDRTGEEFRVVKDPGTCRNVILNGKKLWMLDKQSQLRKLGLWAERLMFTTENAAEVDQVLLAYQQEGTFEPGSGTRGLYLRGVE